MRIWLVRHGESLGNVDEAAWAKIPDHQIPLTEFGMDQAQNAGKLIRDYYQGDEALKDKKVRLWYSPFLRTEQTKDGVASGLGHSLISNAKDGKVGWEDDRLREQDFGMFSRLSSKEEQFKHFPLEAEHFYNTRDHKGRYWAKAPVGESRADVCLRVGNAIDSLMRDVKEGHEDLVVVTHGGVQSRYVTWASDKGPSDVCLSAADVVSFNCA
jgi:2,3-bisphosphoglycerate-dependent phosphoglycerate mutase